MSNIEFIEDTHTYLADGIIVPSVSELIRFKFPDAYANVPKKVLKKKASYGSHVHQTIESFVKGELTMEEIQKKKIDPDIKIAVEQFEILRKMWAFQVRDMEQIVTYKGRYAGTYDIRTIDDYIIDLKTTAELHEEWLRWQISLYYLGVGKYQDFGFAIWLPKGKVGKVVQINTLPKEECERLVDDYYRSLETGCRL